MKRIILFSILSLIIGYQSIAQLNFGPSFGISTVKIPTFSRVFTDQTTRDSFLLSYYDADYGYHFGAFLRYEYKKFYVQPEIVFNSNKTTYRLKNLNAIVQQDTFRKEKYQNLDLAMMLGYRIGILRFCAGPVAHIFVNNSSELTDITGYEDKFKSATFAYHLGFGFNLSRLTFDLRWEQNFTRYGDYITINGENYAFSKAPTKVLASIGFMF